MRGLISSRDWKGLVGKYGANGTALMVESWLDKGVKGESGGITFNDISLHSLIEGTVANGREFITSMNPVFGENSVYTEAIDAVDLTTFTMITRKVISARVMAASQSPALVLQQLIPNIRTQLDGEIMPGTQQPGSDFTEVKELMPYPHYQFGEDYQETPKGAKFGRIIAVSREAVFFDRFNMVLRTAANVGTMLFVHKEKRLARVVAGVINNYKRQGTTYNTYLTSGKWINDQENPAVDYKDYDQSMALFRAMVDFNNGEPITVMPRTIIGSESRELLWASILNARYNQTGDGASGTVATYYDNPIQGKSTFVTSRYLENEIVANSLANSTQAQDWWFHGDFGQAFAYMENWPVTVTEAPRNSEASFNQDIVTQYKADERGVAAVMDPQHVVRNKHTTG